VSTLPTLVCPVCATENPPTRQFCWKCAADLHAIVQPAPQAVAPTAPTARAPLPVRPILIGGGVALAILVLLAGLVLVLGGSPAASPSPAPTASPVPSASPATTVVPTTAPTAAQTPTAAPAKTEAPTGTTTPGANPKVDSLTGPRTASCTATNGTSTPGYIHLSWSASNATGVRLSIDPPSPNEAYGFGYQDYPAAGSDDVPFTCDPQLSDANGAYHLYVVTTLHTTGHWAYRYLKVYLKP